MSVAPPAAVPSTVGFEPRLLDRLPTATFTCDCSGRISYWNPAAEKLWGRAPQVGEVLADCALRLAPADGLPIAEDACPVRTAVTHQTDLVDQPLRLKRADGTIQELFATVQLLRSATGAVTGALVWLVESTPRPTESFSPESDLWSYDRVLAALRFGGIAIWNLDLVTETIQLLPSDTPLYGGAKLDGSRAAVAHLVPPDDLAEARKKLSRAIETKTVFAHENRVVWPDGQVRWISSRAQPIFDEHGVAVQILGLSHDITERKLAEQVVVETHDRLRLAIAAGQLGLWEWDLQTNVILLSAEAKSLLGHASDTIAWSDAQQLLHRADAERIMAAAERARTEGCDVMEELRIVRPDGSEVWLYDVARVATSADGTPQRVVGFVQDITARKRSEEQARVATDRLEIALQAGQLGVYDLDLRSDTIYLSPSCQALTGWPTPTGRVEALMATLHPHDIDRMRGLGEHAYRTGTDLHAEYRFFRPDGQERWLADFGRPQYDAAGCPTGMIGVVRDITAERAAAEALRQGEERLQLAMTAGGIGWWEWDIVTGNLLWSTKVWEVYGLAPNSRPLNFELFRSMIHSDDEARVLTAINDSVEHDAPYDIEYRLVRPDGEIRWKTAMATVHREPTGRPLRMVGVMIDITERKRAEFELQASEERYRFLLDHLTDAVMVHDEIGRIVDVNEQTCAQLGYSREELLRMTPADIDPTITPEGLRQINEQLAALQTVTFESHHRRRDGHVFPVEVRARPFLRDGRRFGLSMSTDITARQAIQAALAESEEKFRRLAECLPDPIFVLDPDDRAVPLRVLYVNPAIRRTHGREPSEIIGRSMLDVVDTPETARLASARIVRILDGESVRFEARHRHRDGHEVIVDVHAGLIPWQGRRVILGIDRDITEHRRTEERLNDVMAELAHVARLSTLGEMVAGIAHELGQPLSAVQNYVTACQNTLRDPPPNADKDAILTDWLGQARQAMRVAREVIQRLRAFARKDGRKFREIDLRQIMSEALGIVRIEAARHGVQIHQLVSVEPLLVRADGVQLHQVLVNLLHNAIEASAALPIERRTIELRAERADGRIVVEVADLGPGVPADKVREVFNPFYTTKPQGLGLGLSISRTLVEAHDGSIEVQPNTPQGTRFVVTLPVCDDRVPSA